jgi:hypothetical protein
VLEVVACTYRTWAGATSSHDIQLRSNKELKDKLQLVNTEIDQDPREKLSEQIRTVDEQLGHNKRDLELF